jgi:hypothetical protein
VAQVLAHATPAHSKGVQLAPALAAQLPFPSQSNPLTMPPAQVVAPHETLGRANMRQEPRPSHCPSDLQLEG